MASDDHDGDQSPDFPSGKQTCASPRAGDSPRRHPKSALAGGQLFMPRLPLARVAVCSWRGGLRGAARRHLRAPPKDVQRGAKTCTSSTGGSFRSKRVSMSWRSIIRSGGQTTSGVLMGAPGITPSVRRLRGESRIDSGRDGGAEVLVVALRVRPVDRDRFVCFEVEHLMPADVDDLAYAAALHDVDRAAEGSRAGDEVRDDCVVVVLVQREAGDAVDVVGDVMDVFDGPQWLVGGVEPDLSTDVEEVVEVVVEGPGRVELRAVDRVREVEVELEPFRRRRGGRPCGNAGTPAACCECQGRHEQGASFHLMAPSVKGLGQPRAMSCAPVT